MRYRRIHVAGGTYFFTVNLAQRRSGLLVRHIDDLRTAIREVKARHPFLIVAMVVLPDHLHAIWRLPEGDANYAMRWSLIKAAFSRRVEKGESIDPSRKKKHERRVWQRRYWEHWIRDENDLRRHVDYIHYNPVKHGWVQRAVDWQYSTLHRYIERGLVPTHWGSNPSAHDDVDAGWMPD
ncbi:REP-associated tyrosine transposase [Noviherbaspirillum pedocola]|uniref:Transposase n=1 Tax=Noviherbaspirillum pedocola TaxID=2801341 RepID=A0A934T3N4_9BURK|nr:transposase [Noviherbaspirillum pedocola]MBK4737963.1 transposase [Noviherbaspirillum pedocola]